MRYVVYALGGGDVALGSTTDGVMMTTDYFEFEFTLEQFKEFRKAVGYVWQDVHDD